MRGCAQIIPLAGDHMSHPAPGIVHVPVITRDDVDVQVLDRLTGGRTDVDAHVVPGRVVAHVEPLANNVDKVEQGYALGRRGVEPVRYDSAGDYECVPGTDGKTVWNGES